MGRAIAIGLAAEGAKIACCDLRETANDKGYESDLGKTTGEVISSNGGESVFYQADISDVDGVALLFKSIMEVSQIGHL